MSRIGRTYQKQPEVSSNNDVLQPTVPSAISIRYSKLATHHSSDMNSFLRIVQVITTKLCGNLSHAPLSHSTLTYAGITHSGGGFGINRPSPRKLFTEVNDHGMNTVRIPVLWEGMQNEAGSWLTAGDPGYLKMIIELARDAATIAIVGPHTTKVQSSATALRYRRQFAGLRSALVTEELIGCDQAILALVREPSQHNTKMASLNSIQQYLQPIQ